MKPSYIFEVETIYKSGRNRTDYIETYSEKNMWRIYDEHHKKSKIESSTIVDSWIA